MSLEEKRGYKQAAFTRLRSSLSRYIALSDIPNVKLYTDKLKFAFAAYEAAHEVVLESVNMEEHQATYDKEGEQFVQTEELFVQSLHSAGACLNAASTSTIDAISQLMNVPRVEIQSFDGAAASYMTFVAVFDEVVGNVNISGQAKLTRLLQFTTGTARDAIDCCALIGGDQGYDEARRILRERFGDPYIITTALIDKLKQQKEVRTPSALRTLADELNSAKIVLKSLNMYSELDNQHHIKEVGARLSSHLWYAWRDRVFNIKRKNKRYATFDEFVEFVTEKADEANDPVYGQKSSSASFNEKSRPSPTPKRATALNNVVSSDFKRKACDVCQEQHPLWRCDIFKKLTIDKRKEAVVKHKLCINCLMSGHDVINCVKPSFCRVSDCTAKHNKLLHETVVANHKIDTTVCNVCMPVVPALAGGMDIFCLLDTGSTSTFVSKKLATKLNLNVIATQLNLMTLNSSVSKTADTVNLAIESIDRNFSIDMRSIYVVDSIPTKSYTIDVKAYSHLRDIDFVSTFDHEVDLLIGQDYASCFVPLEVRKGLKNEPYAVRTPLGYVVNGGNGGYHNSAISHLISTTTIERDISKLWELDQYDTSPTCGYTQDERRVIDLWDDQSVLVDKHWVIPIPWNDKVPDLHNNYHSSWYRLKKPMAWLIKIRDKLLSRPCHNQSITVSDMNTAEREILKYIQSITMDSTRRTLLSGKSVSARGHLHKLDPALDDGIIIVKERFTHALLHERMKTPIIIPHDHRVAMLIVRDLHNSCHLGQEWLISLVRRKYWITHIRKIVKAVARGCVVCKRRFALPDCQKMADLPVARVDPCHPPFYSIGLDCFGPYMVKYGRGNIKRYGCIFTCMTTRAVHIEKLDTLDSDSFINALRRFTSRRGTPHSIYCDNGTNIVGGHNELKRALKSVVREPIESFCLKSDIIWTFNPPHASHMGGVYERMMRTIRKVFLGVLHPNVRLTDEILETVLCEVEGIINGRPITKLSPDVDDIAVLTPNNFLIMKDEIKVAPGSFTVGDMYRKRWRHTQHIIDSFWKKWISCYLPDLQKRVKWQNARRNLAIGDLVLVLDESAPRGLWPLALVKIVFTSTDGLVRSVRVKTSTSEYVRPIAKIVMLEGQEMFE